MHQLFFLCCFIFALHLSEIMLFLFCLSLWRCRFVVVFVLKSNSSVSHSMVSMKNQVAEAKHTNTHTRHHLFSNPVGWVFFFFYLIRCGCCWFAPIYLFSLSFFSLFFFCLYSLTRQNSKNSQICVCAQRMYIVCDLWCVWMCASVCNACIEIDKDGLGMQTVPTECGKALGKRYIEVNAWLEWRFAKTGCT